MKILTQNRKKAKHQFDVLPTPISLSLWGEFGSFAYSRFPVKHDLWGKYLFSIYFVVADLTTEIALSKISRSTGGNARASFVISGRFS